MEHSLVKDVGSRIRHLRTERKWTQVELGKRCGYKQSYIGQIERGEQNITLETLEHILVALDISVARFFEK